MKFTDVFTAITALICPTSATILENGCPRPTSYPDIRIDPKTYDWKTYEADAHELSYKGRWDSKHISWWSPRPEVRNTEYSITAYPGICLFDKRCYGNLRGQFYQWFHTSDTSGRAIEIWGDHPEVWDFSKQPAADIVVIGIGTNDANPSNNVTADGYVTQYTILIEGIHGVWPEAQIILHSLWEGFGAVGNTTSKAPASTRRSNSIYQYFNSPEYLPNPTIYDPVTNNKPSTNRVDKNLKPFVHYFNTTGLMQQNGIGPLYHPTDVGHIKIASYMIQYIKLMFGWVLYAMGPEV